MPERPIGSAAGTSRKPTRQQRARRVQRLAVTWTVIAFVAAWGLIYTQMRAGNDPALGAGASTAATTPASTTAVDTGSSSSSFADTTTNSADTTSQTASSTRAPSAATTSQS